MENKNIAYYEDESVWASTLNAKSPEHIWSLLEKELGNEMTGDVLEIGSGTWVYYEYLKNAKSLTSIEFTDANIKHLRSKGYENIIKYDLNNYPYPLADNSCDFILFSHVLEHLYAPVLALSECYRMLKPGGTLLLWVPNSGSLIYNNWDFEGHFYAINYKGWKFTIETAGFEVEKMYVNGLLSSNTTYLKYMQPVFRLIGQDPFYICKKKK
jgi:SAM-dependent methyltransferase